MGNKLGVILAVLFLGAASFRTDAQESRYYAGPATREFISTGVGINMLMAENVKVKNMFITTRPGISFDAGRWLLPSFAIRGSLAWWNQAGVSLPSSPKPTYPYQMFAAFADGMLSIPCLIWGRRDDIPWDVDLYAGVGLGVTFGYYGSIDEVISQGYKVDKTSRVNPSGHAGFRGTYRLDDRLDAYGQIGLCFTNDWHNGVYGGRPYDLVGTLQFGIVYNLPMEISPRRFATSVNIDAARMAAMKSDLAEAEAELAKAKEPLHRTVEDLHIEYGLYYIIGFIPRSVRIDSPQKASLKAISRYLGFHPSDKILITGYGDLAEKRIETVWNYLTEELAVNPEKIEAATLASDEADKDIVPADSVIITIFEEENKI